MITTRCRWPDRFEIGRAEVIREIGGTHTWCSVHPYQFDTEPTWDSVESEKKGIKINLWFSMSDGVEVWYNGKRDYIWIGEGDGEVWLKNWTWIENQQ